MRFVPHPYQKYCITRIIGEPALALFLDMGLGKTVITLTAINDLRYNRFEVNRCLVIAPKKVAEDTWAREAAKWDHLKLLRIVPVLGSQAKRIKAINSPGDVYVISRDNVKWLVEYYRNEWPFDMVVVDELSSFKNHQAVRFKKLKMVRGRISRIIGLTGTPAPNGLIDLWAQIYLLDQGQRLGTTITGYRRDFFDPDARNRETIFSYKPKQWAEAAINDRIRDICISLSAADYLTLPERIINTRHIQLDPKAKKQYDTLEREMLIQVDQEDIDVTSAAALSNKLLQLCNGAVYDSDRGVHEIHDAKLEALQEIVEASQGNPILVFYNFKHDKERILQTFKNSRLRISDLKSPESVSSWNAGYIDMLLAHPASAAYGLNLQDGGHIVVWFGLNWSLELYQQANARLHRQGQMQSVIIHHLVVSGGLDEDVMEALDGKQATQDTLLEALKARISDAKKEDTKNE